MSWWMHGVGHAAHEESKVAAIFLIVVGIFFAPVGIGIPILLLGIYKLSK